MNQHGYYDPDRIYPAGSAPPEAGAKCSCCRYWRLEAPNDADLTRRPGDPLVTVTLGDEGISGYWSPEPHPRMMRFHRDNQQDTLF